MKPFFLIFSYLFVISSACIAQNTVVDTHPTARIFAIDYSTGQEAPATFDAAILFKNALIDLVSNTAVARMQFAQAVPGRKEIVVTQMDPQTNGNAYQLVLQSNFLNRINTIYTFVYSVDQNILSYLNPQVRRYVQVAIQGPNVNNLNNCYAYGKFNVQQAQPVSAAPPQAVIDASAGATPIDADVTTDAAPPALPDYDQPECPVDGYLWQPGFWAYGRDVRSYYWVPGAWVAPPSADMLWTPPYWGFDGGIYAFHSGYWGNTIGFYGGVNYGFGYGGVGFVGGNWYGGHFRYNTAVLRVNVTVVHNVYVDRTVIVAGNTSHASFNGRGGVIATPNNREMAAMKEHHIMATPEQIRNQQSARADKSQFASANGGRPATFASPRALDTRPAAAAAPAARPGIAGNQTPAAQAARPGMAPAPGTSPVAAAPGARPAVPGANPPVPGAKPGSPAATGANKAALKKQAYKQKTPPPAKQEKP